MLAPGINLNDILNALREEFRIEHDGLVARYPQGEEEIGGEKFLSEYFVIVSSYTKKVSGVYEQNGVRPDIASLKEPLRELDDGTLHVGLLHITFQDLIDHEMACFERILALAREGVPGPDATYLSINELNWGEEPNPLEIMIGCLATCDNRLPSEILQPADRDAG